MSFSLHHEKSAQRTFAILRMIRRTFSRIARMDFQILYGACVRPLLEYANQVVYTGHMKDVALIERVQRGATKQMRLPQKFLLIKRPSPGSGGRLLPLWQLPNARRTYLKPHTKPVDSRRSLEAHPNYFRLNYRFFEVVTFTASYSYPFTLAGDMLLIALYLSVRTFKVTVHHRFAFCCRYTGVLAQIKQIEAILWVHVTPASDKYCGYGELRAIHQTGCGSRGTVIATPYLGPCTAPCMNVLGLRCPCIHGCTFDDARVPWIPGLKSIPLGLRLTHIHPSLALTLLRSIVHMVAVYRYRIIDLHTGFIGQVCNAAVKLEARQKLREEIIKTNSRKCKEAYGRFLVSAFTPQYQKIFFRHTTVLERCVPPHSTPFGKLPVSRSTVSLRLGSTIPLVFRSCCLKLSCVPRKLREPKFFRSLHSSEGCDHIQLGHVAKRTTRRRLSAGIKSGRGASARVRNTTPTPVYPAAVASASAETDVPVARVYTGTGKEMGVASSRLVLLTRPAVYTNFCFTLLTDGRELIGARHSVLRYTYSLVMFDVYLYVYDLSCGVVKALSPIALGKQIDGIWHTSVVLHNKEYFYGSHGISFCTPEHTVLGKPGQKVYMGQTSVTEAELSNYLEHLAVTSFRGGHYRLFDHNCNTFSNHLCGYLTNKEIPEYIVSLPADVASTPLGAVLKPYLNTLSVGLNNVPQFGLEATKEIGVTTKLVVTTSVSDTNNHCIEEIKRSFVPILFDEPLPSDIIPHRVHLLWSDDDHSTKAELAVAATKIVVESQSSVNLTPEHYSLLELSELETADQCLVACELFRLALWRDPDLLTAMLTDPDRHLHRLAVAELPVTSPNEVLDLTVAKAKVGRSFINRSFTFRPVLKQRYVYRLTTTLMSLDFEGLFDCVDWSVLRMFNRFVVGRLVMQVLESLQNSTAQIATGEDHVGHDFADVIVLS
ncbi:PPPDE peptidase domain-containing protein 2 [Clonorchis sinensis]|uniref:PPPDE peptidase domain-containing protein 2 n=1 Tax=Clonorchis sinensis TaxID=79923 RepID=G7YP05_CLOSI|nr:PPPDE peptidase domain-containing protein 2 [Clonorchis sinensis]